MKKTVFLAYHVEYGFTAVFEKLPENTDYVQISKSVEVEFDVNPAAANLMVAHKIEQKESKRIELALEQLKQAIS